MKSRPCQISQQEMAVFKDIQAVGTTGTTVTTPFHESGKLGGLVINRSLSSLEIITNLDGRWPDRFWQQGENVFDAVAFQIKRVEILMQQRNTDNVRCFEHDADATCEIPTLNPLQERSGNANPLCQFRHRHSVADPLLADHAAEY